jgi:hypothetical protein
VLLTAEGSWRGGKIAALSVENGKQLWEGKTKQPLSNNVDVKTGEGYAYNGFRSTCQYGVMPANGMLYVPPNSCACCIQDNPTGLKAMASAWKPLPSPTARLEKGPAYGAFRTPQSAVRSGEWATYRGDSARSGLARCELPVSARRIWTAELGGRLYVSCTDGKLRCFGGK